MTDAEKRLRQDVVDAQGPGGQYALVKITLADAERCNDWISIWGEARRVLAEIDRLREWKELQGKLLVCYRLGKRPPGKVLDRLAELREADDEK